MVHSILKFIGGIERYGIISLCLFCTIFVGALVWALLQKRSHLDYMARVALDPETDDLTTRKDSHEQR